MPSDQSLNVIPIGQSSMSSRLRQRSLAISTAPEPVSRDLQSLSDFLTTALFSAVTCSLASAFSQRRTLRLLGKPNGYLPSIASSEGGAHQLLDEELSSYLKGAYQQVEFALKLSQPSFDVAGTELHSSQDWPQLAHLWQSTCGQIRLLLLTLADHPTVRGSKHIPRVLEIEALVKRARYGETPCVRSDGTVFVPSWLDQRRDRRIPIDISVVCDFGRGAVRAILKDLSSSGAGLSSCPSLRTQTPVKIALPTGRQLTGRVVWCHGGSVGILFDTPLQDTDPLFTSIPSLRRLVQTDSQV